MPEVQELRRYRCGDERAKAAESYVRLLSLARKSGLNHRQRYRAERLAEYRARNNRVKWMLV